MIGDVCGKGAEAAAVTALARYTVRASATLHSDSPSVVLQDLNDAIRRESAAQPLLHRALRLAHAATATRVTRLRRHRAGTRCRWSCAPTGASRRPACPARCSGILPDPEIRPQKLVLRPGDSLVLYTDGVIEASPLDDRFGPEQFARVRQRVPRPRADRRSPAASRTRCSRSRAARCATTSPCVVLRVSPRVAAPFVADQPGVAASHVKLLVLTPEPVDANAAALRARRRGRGRRGARRSRPATNQSKVAFWVSDSDEAIEEAEDAQEETVERLEEEGVDAAGDTGESEPAVAIQDALATFAADRIVVFSHPEGDRDYREDEGLADAEPRFGVPLTHALIER